ncbi:MAG: hypothetical protein ISQ67_07880 [Luminiphilus sp.]|nr:hypothetical protein [Luminiphilus sp.]
MILQPQLAQALSQCQPFRSLEGHAAQIMRGSPEMSEDRADVINTLQAVCDAGLMESSEQAWQRLVEQKVWPQDTGCRIFILTCDRPKALARLLSGLHAQALPPQVEGICVIDDSRDPACATENEQLLTQAQDRTGLPLSHFDISAREALITTLKEQLPDCAEEIGFLLERARWGQAPTFGLARNLTLLLSAGKRALVFDDDVIPEAITPPLAATQMTVGSANDRQAVFYANEDALNQHALALPDSPVSLMLNHLGKPLGDVLASSLPGPQALAGWDGELLARFTAQSPVLMTQCGSWGDPGTGSGEWAYFLQQPSVQRLLALDSDLEQTLAARSSWFGYRGPTVSQYGTLSQLTGLANHTLLPPYPPAGRGEDIFFGLLLQRMYPTSAVWNEGWAIRHAPLEDRASRGALSPLDVKAGMATVGDWIGREPADQWGQTPETNLVAVSEQIMRLSTMDNHALAELANQEAVSKASSLLRRCFEHIDCLAQLESEPGYPQWRGFLEQTRDQLVQRIQTPNADPLSASITASGGEAALRGRAQQLAGALKAWPKIWGAARGLIA